MRHFNKSISSGDMRPAYATDRRLVVSCPVRGPSQRAAEDLSSSRPTLWMPPYRGLESSGQGAKRADAHGSRYISYLGYEGIEQWDNERALCAGTNYEPLTIKDAPMYNLNMGIMGITINTNCHLNESGSRNRARPIELTERKGGALIALP